MKQTKWIQFGDLHLDAPMRSLRPETAAARRKAARGLLNEIIRYAEQTGACAILCTGDLFDSQTPYRDTVEAAAQAFAGTALPVFLTPGNHDFYTGASPYCQAEWSGNVHIFKSETPETATLGGVSVTGTAFCSDQPGLHPLRLLTTGSCAGGVFAGHGEPFVQDSAYAAYPQGEIAASGLAYLALGHIHQPDARMAGRTLVVQNGSVEGRGLDETGERGFYEVTLGGDVPVWKLIPSSGSRVVRMAVPDVPGDTPSLAAAVLAQCETAPERTILRLTAGAADPEALLSVLGRRFLDVRLTAPERPAAVPAVQSPLMRLFCARAKAAMDAAKTAEARQIAETALRFGLAAMENREEPHGACGTERF